MSALIQNDYYLRIVLDTLPTAVFVVDHEFKIFDLNPAATELFGINSDAILHRLCGEVMHCMHAMEPQNCCGATEYCPDCVIRNSVETALRGKVTHRQNYKMKVKKNGEISDVHMLVSTSSFKYEDGDFVLLSLEDITEVTKLKQIIPICASCNKIRNDEDYWEKVTDYLRTHTELQFTHSLCPECVRRLYPHLKK